MSTSDLGSLFEEMNTRFGTAFTPFVHTPENVERVFAFIEERAARPAYEPHIGRYMPGSRPRRSSTPHAGRPPAPAGPARPVRAPRRTPVASRDELRAGLLARYGDPALASLRQRAEHVYAAFAAEPPR